MNKFFKGKRAQLTTAGMLALAAATGVNAAAVDTTSVVQVISDAGVAAAAIGVAVLSMHYGIKLYKWIKGAG